MCEWHMTGKWKSDLLKSYQACFDLCLFQSLRVFACFGCRYVGRFVLAPVGFGKNNTSSCDVWKNVLEWERLKLTHHFSKLYFFLQRLFKMLICIFQAGDLYEKIKNSSKAMECYRKGKAYKKGASLMVEFIILPSWCSWSHLAQYSCITN